MTVASVDRLAKTLIQRVDRVDRKVRDLQNKNDLGFSSIEDSQSINVYDTTGTPEASFGGQFDGSAGAFSLTGPEPPMPSAPVPLETGWARVKLRWDGLFAGADGVTDETIVAPMDFSRVEVHASQDPAFTAEFNTTIRDTIETPRGRESIFFAPPGTWYVRLVTRTLSGKASVATAPITVVSEALEPNTEFRDAIVSRMAIYLTNTDGTGNTSVVDGQGLRVYNTEAVTGEVQERVRVGTHSGDGDYFSIADDGGVPTVVMDKTGQIVGRHGNFTDSLTYKGTELEAYVGDRPGGIVAWTGRGTRSAVDSTGNVLPYLRITFPDVQGRSYSVEVSGLVGYITQATGAGIVNLHFRQDGQPATINDPIIARCQLASAAGSTSLTTSGHMQRLFIGGSSGTTSLLLSFYRNQSTGFFGMGPLANSPVYMVVKDIGGGANLNSLNVGEFLDGTATPPPATSTQTVEWGYTGVRSYLGSDATYAYNTAKGYQGLSPAGYGNLKSIWTFNSTSVASYLSGATIHDIWIKFRFEHWYYSGGGTAKIRMHAHASLPSTFSATSNGMDKGGWPIGAEYWVRVPDSLYEGWKTGAYKGAALVGDGTYQTYGIANYCRLKIRFTK